MKQTLNMRPQVATNLR